MNKYQKVISMPNSESNKHRHSPTLKTVLMVEEAIKSSGGPAVTVPQIKRSLPKQVNHRTLMAVLEYLEAKGLVRVTLQGISWAQEFKEEGRHEEKERRPFEGIA